MKAAFTRAAAGIDAVSVREVPEPSPGARQALVRLKAATLNFRDLLFVRGQLAGAKSPEIAINLL